MQCHQWRNGNIWLWQLWRNMAINAGVAAMQWQYRNVKSSAANNGYCG